MIATQYKYRIEVELTAPHVRSNLAPFVVNPISRDARWFVGELVTPYPIPGCTEHRTYGLSIIRDANGGVFCLSLDDGNDVPIRAFNYPFVLF